MSASTACRPGHPGSSFRGSACPGTPSTLVLAVALAASVTGILHDSRAAAQGIYFGTAGTGDNFGTSVTGVGDLNNDGFEDFVVGDPGDDLSGTNRGRVFVYFGRGANLGAEADLELSAGNGGDQFGYDVVGIGRFNGDEYDDLAVGAPFNDSGGAEAGRVYVFFGGSPMNSGVDLTLNGLQGGDHFGFSLAGRFDFDNDGFDDLAVGAPDRSSVLQRAGEVRIYLGGSNPSTTAEFVIGGEQAQDAFGYDVSRAGRFNSDAYDDIVVGAPQPFDLNPGKASVLLGRGSAGSVTRITFTGEISTDHFGWAVSGGGDVDGDGYDDVAVGAPYHDPNNLDGGAAYLYRGGSSADIERDDKIRGGLSDDHLGWSLALDGDFNGDGRADLLTGSRDANDGGNDSGNLEIWYGGSPLLATEPVTILGPELAPGLAAGDHFGAAAGWVDYNGDGRSEALGGAPDGNQLSGETVGLVSLNFAPGTLVPIALTGFTARWEDGIVRLGWRTSGTPEAVGFHVDRRVPESEGWQRLTASPIPPRADGSAEWRDAPSATGRIEYQVVAVTRDGRSVAFGPFGVTPEVRSSLALLQSAPNPLPAGQSARIVFSTDRGGHARVEIFDGMGRRVRTLLDAEVGAGLTELAWDGSDGSGQRLPAGVYVYRLNLDGAIAARKLHLTR